MLFLAIQSYRYGFYELVYTATFLIPLLGFGIAYTYAQRYVEIKDIAHPFLLSVMVVLIASNINNTPTNATIWLYPFGLLSYLILPFRASNVFNVGVITLITLYVVFQQGLHNGALFFASYALISGVAAIFAYLHHHKNLLLFHEVD